MKIRIKDRAEFRSDKMAKIALATTSRTQLDLYCLARLEALLLAVHHDVREPGEAIVARAGQEHGIRNAGAGRLLAMVVVTPPPPHA